MPHAIRILSFQIPGKILGRCYFFLSYHPVPGQPPDSTLPIKGVIHIINAIMPIVLVSAAKGQPPDSTLPIKGAIHSINAIMPIGLASAAEAKVAACLLKAQQVCVNQATLKFLGHAQPSTPFQTENQCSTQQSNKKVSRQLICPTTGNHYLLSHSIPMFFLHISFLFFFNITNAKKNYPHIYHISYRKIS